MILATIDPVGLVANEAYEWKPFCSSQKQELLKGEHSKDTVTLDDECDLALFGRSPVSQSIYCHDEKNNESILGFEPQLTSTPTKGSTSVPADDHQYLVWKERIWMPLNYLLKHENSSIFHRRTSGSDDDDILPQTMNLRALRKSIKRGSVRSTNEFKYRITLMCSYALFYYENDTAKCVMAEELLRDALAFTDFIMKGC